MTSATAAVVDQRMIVVASKPKTKGDEDVNDIFNIDMS